ncbi:MAG: HAMP domain-containing protein, partial [Methanosarcinales archaeon]|nr:HAMP domain-containing protein [Methanosarcinales archaeon]
MNILNNMPVNKRLMAGFALVLLLILLEKSIRYLEYVAASSVSTAIAAFVTAAIIMGVVNALILSRMITRSLNRIMVGANKTHNAGMGYGVLGVSGVVTTPGSPTAAEEYSEDVPMDPERENLQEEQQEGMDNERQSLEDITLIDQLTGEEDAAASNDAAPDDRLSSREGQVADQTDREEQNNDLTGGKSEMEEYEARLDQLTTENEYLKTQIRDFVPLMNSLAEGNLTKRAAKTKDDELGELADAYNSTVENIQALAEDAGVLAEAGIEGKLDVRADASKHGGEFRKIVDGVNDTLDAVIGPLNVAA